MEVIYRNLWDIFIFRLKFGSWTIAEFYETFEDPTAVTMTII
jgi:hypothetical protein